MEIFSRGHRMLRTFQTVDNRDCADILMLLK